jgi:hypothetical protein
LDDKLSWQQIKRDVCSREARIIDEGEILNEIKLFVMNKKEFENMINLLKGKKSLKRRKDPYRINDLQIIFIF